MDPAVNGTLYACRAAHANKVKRMVITSSCVSMMYNGDRNNTHFDEKSWSEEKWSDWYPLSKMLAERAAWEHQKECGNSYEIATINPGFIMGTPIIGGSYSSSDFAKMMVVGKGMFPSLPPISLPFTDVAQVAEAHYKATIIPEAAGRRFIMCHSAPLIPLVGQWFAEKYRPMGYKTMTKTMGKFPINCFACCVK